MYFRLHVECDLLALHENFHIRTASVTVSLNHVTISGRTTEHGGFVRLGFTGLARADRQTLPNFLIPDDRSQRRRATLSLRGGRPRLRPCDSESGPFEISER